MSTNKKYFNEMMNSGPTVEDQFLMKPTQQSGQSEESCRLQTIFLRAAISLCLKIFSKFSIIFIDDLLVFGSSNSASLP